MPVNGLIVDLSSNNGHPIDYAAAKAAGVIAANIKATDGQNYTNPYYATDVAGFQAVGVPTRAYHFAQFSQVQLEVEKFIAVAGANARILDSETSTNAVWQQQFLDLLAQRLSITAGEEMDYGSSSTLPQGVRALLWPAAYGSTPSFGALDQYTDAGAVPGIPGSVDLSRWTGTQEQFDVIYGLTPVVPPAPTSSDSLVVLAA